MAKTSVKTTAKITGNFRWSDETTAKEAGEDITTYILF